MWLWLPRVIRPRWPVKHRVEVRGAVLHDSVLDRFRAGLVLQHSHQRPYRPDNLRKDERLAEFYEGPEDGVG